LKNFIRGIDWAVLCGISAYLRGDTEGRGGDFAEQS